MASEYDPLVRILHSESEEDIGLPWCPAEGDHGKCTAYLAQVISDDQDSQHTDNEEELSDDFQPLGKGGEGVGEETSEEGERVDDNIEGGERGFPALAFPTPHLSPSPPLLNLTLSATEECRYDRFIENGVHVTHDISRQTPPFISFAESGIIQDDFSAVTHLNDDDVTTYHSTLCIVESEDPLFINEKEDECESDMICGSIDKSNQLISKPCGTTSHETFLKKDVDESSAAQTRDDISDIMSDSGLEKNEENERFFANSHIDSTDIASLIMSATSSGTEVSQISKRDLTWSCDGSSYPVSPMRTPYPVRIIDEEEGEYIFKEDNSVESGTLDVALCELLKGDNEEEAVAEKHHLRQEQNDEEEHAEAPYPPGVPEAVEGSLNIAHSPVTVCDTEDAEMNSDGDGKEGNTDGEMKDDKDGDERVDDGEVGSERDRNEGIEIEEIVDYGGVNEGIGKAEVRVVGIKKEEIIFDREGAKGTINETISICKDGSTELENNDMRDNDGRNEDIKNEKASGDEDRNEGIENEEMNDNRDGNERKLKEEMSDYSYGEELIGIAGLFEMSEGKLEEPKEDLIAEDTNDHLSSMDFELDDHEDSDGSLQANLSVNDGMISHRFSDATDGNDGKDSLEEIDECSVNSYVKREDFMVKEEGNDEITEESVDDSPEIEEDFMNENFQTFSQKYEVEYVELKNGESDAEIIENEHSLIAERSIHSYLDHNTESSNEGIIGEDDDFGLVNLFTKLDGNQHKETSISCDDHQDIIEALVPDDHNPRVITYGETCVMEDRMGSSKRDNDVMSPSSSGHSRIIDLRASACDVGIVRTITDTFVQGEEGFTGQIGKDEVASDSLWASEGPEKDFDLDKEEKTVQTQELGEISLTQFFSESEDVGEYNEYYRTGQVTPHFFESVQSAAKCQSSSLLAPRDRSSFLATLLQGGDALSNENTNTVECVSELKDFCCEIVPKNYSDEAFHEECKYLVDSDNESTVTDKDSKIIESEVEVIESETSEDQCSYHQPNEEEYNLSALFENQRVNGTFSDGGGHIDESITDSIATILKVPNPSIPEIADIPLSQVSDLPILEVPDLSRVKVSDISEVSVTSIPEVQELSDLSISEVSDLPISEVSGLPISEVQDLPKAELSGLSLSEVSDLPIPELQDLPIVKFLDLSISEASDLPISEVQDLPKAEYSDLSISEASDLPLPEVLDLSITEHSDLSIAEASDIPIPEVQELPIAEYSDLSVSEASDLPLSEVLDLPVAELPEQAVSAVTFPPLSEPEDPDLSVSEIPGLLISEIQSLFISEAQDLSLSGTQYSTPIPKSDAQDLNVNINSELGIPCPIREEIEQEVPVIILTSSTETAPEEGREDTDDSSLSLSDEDELVSSVITVIAADQFETQIEEVDDIGVDSSFPSAIEHVDYPSESDVINKSADLESEEVLSDNGELVKDLSTNDLYLEADVSQINHLSEDSFSGWVNQVCSVFCQSDARFHDTDDHIISAEKDTSASQVIDEYPSKLLFPEKSVTSSSPPVVLNSDFTCLPAATILSEDCGLIPSSVINTYSLREKPEHCNNTVSLEGDIPENETVVINEEEIGDVLSFSESVLRSVDDARNNSENNEEFSPHIAREEQNYISSVIENQVDSIPFVDDDPTDITRAAVNENFVDYISTLTETRSIDLQLISQNQDGGSVAVVESQEEKISAVVENRGNSISILTKDQERGISPVTENREDNISPVFENQESRIPRVNQSDGILLVTENQENYISAVIENQENNNSVLTVNQEDRISPVIENQVVENQEESFSPASEKEEGRISPWTANQGAVEKQEEFTSFMTEGYVHHLSEDQEDYSSQFDDSQVYYIPLVEEDQEYFTSLVTEDHSSSFLIEDQELPVSPVNEDQVDFTLGDRGRLTKYISLVDKDNYNYGLSAFEDEVDYLPVVIENRENYIQCTVEDNTKHIPPPSLGQVDLTPVADYKADVISPVDGNTKSTGSDEYFNSSGVKTCDLEEINNVEDRGLACKECQPFDVPFVTKPQDDNDNLLVEGQSESEILGGEVSEFETDDHENLLISENRNCSEKGHEKSDLEEDSLVHLFVSSDESEDDFSKYTEGVISQVESEIKETVPQTESVVSQEDISNFLSEEKEEKVTSEENESDAAYASSLQREVERIDFIGGVIGGVKEGWHSLPSSAVEGKLHFDSFLSVIEEEDQIDSIPTGIDTDRTDSSPPAKALDISVEELQVPSVPREEEEEAETEEGKEVSREGKGRDGLLILAAPGSYAGCVELQSARDDQNSKLPKEEEVFERETNVDDIAVVTSDVASKGEIHSAEKEAERETGREGETLLEISSANGNDLDEISGFNGESKLVETSEGATVDAVADTKEELDSFVGSGELQGRSQFVVENVDGNSDESVVGENPSDQDFGYNGDKKEESVAQFSSGNDEIQTEKFEKVVVTEEIPVKSNIVSVSLNDECESLESASQAKAKESTFPYSSFEEALSVSSEMSVDADFGQRDSGSELTRSEMSESSNRDSGTSYLSEADGSSDNDTLVGRNSDADGMMNSDGDGMAMSSSSSSEEGTITGSRESSNVGNVISSSSSSSGDVNYVNFNKGHRRDDSGVVMGNFPVDAAHHFHHPHQRQDMPGSPVIRASHPHCQRAGGENEHHHHHHCCEHCHIADHHCHHHHHQHASASDDQRNRINIHKRTVEDEGSFTEPEDNNRTLERGMSPAPTDPEDDDTGSVKGFTRSRSHQFRVARRFSGAKMVKKMKKVVHFGKKSQSDDNGNHPHHTKVQEALEGESFGKRSGGGGRRTNECLILEPSEMIVIDYPDVQLMRPGQRASCNTMSLEKLMALEQDEVNIRPPGRGAPPPPPGHHHAHQFENEQMHGQHIPHSHDPYLPDLVMGSGILRGARSRGSVGSSVRDGSDTSSAYSGSDTMCHSLHSSLEPDDVDLSGLTESAVDSDEEDLAESMESLTVRDCVRECLEKDPSERTEDDLEILLEFTQRLQAFSNMTLAVRKDMCQAMVFAVVEDAGTILMHQGEELDSWSVIINGHVEVTHLDGSVHELSLGDSFGITPTMEKLYHQGIMRSKVDDCQFVCIRQTDYYRILHRGEENTRRVEEDGIVVLVTEQRPIDGGNRKGNIVIKGTPEKLMCQLVEVENNVDPTYVEDFLLTHRTFVDKPLTVANKLLNWFEDPTLRDRVTRVVLLWVNNHFTDFEMDLVMMNFLEQFEEGLEREKMAGQLRLLDFACATKARARVVTLTRPSRDEILHFSILGGYERGHGIFISKVEKGSKAEEVGLKRGDQILEVNGQSFDHMNHARALEILRQPCHLSITVKSNLLAFKEMLSTPDNSPRPHARKTSDVRGLSEGNGHMSIGNFGATVNMAGDHSQQSPRDKGKDDKNKSSFMTIGASTAKQFKKKIINSFVPKQTPESHMNSDESVSSQSSVGGGGLYHSHSNPDLSTAGAYEDVRAEFPEHVLKVYRATDHSSRFLPVHKETTAREVVMLALQIFNINDPSGSSNYALYEVTVTEEGITKQKRLPDSLQNLAERIGLSSRYYLKNITVSQTHVPDDIVNELVRESAVCFLQLNSVELAVQLTLEDYTIFRQIEPTEYIDYLFNLKSNYGTVALSQFEGLVNREMFWVVTEVCSEHNLVKRSKIIKQFIKVARQCKECKNFNSMFAILGGLGHGAVSRLKQTWERLPTKYSRMFTDMQDLMDPSRNMSKYRNLVQNENIQSPIIPFYPVVARDLTFAHEGNDDKVDGLINFEKLRMISRYIRELQNMCSAPYDLFSIQDAGGQPPSSALISLNQMAAGGHQIATVKRRKKSTAAPDKKKMYEEAQMVRRVKAYLSRLQVVTDEDQLRNMSLECEGGPEGHKSGGSTGSQQNNNNNNSGSSSAPPTNPPPRRRPHSPTPSTTSSTSSTSQTSDGKKQTTKFGATSPQSISKMKALAEPKTKPHHGLRSNNSHHHSLSPSPSPGPPRKGALANHNPRSNHERSHSDTHAVPVDLSAESSSVTSLSKLHKSHTSGSVTSNECQVGPGESDSGISTHFDCHSSSSLEVGGVTSHEWHYHSSPPAQHRRYSHQPESRPRPPFPHGIPVLPPIPTAAQKRFMFNNMRQHCLCNSRVRRGTPGVPPDYVATQQRMKQMGRALSHDGVQYYHHSHHDDEEEDAQVSAV